jgi:hypothetical protein
VRWERRSGLQVPEVLIEASADIVVKAESVRVIALYRPSPAAGGRPLLLWAKERAVYRRATLFSYV